jgi:SpoVK/Ycf46/Vps4 family AAA+-type ATPase
LEKIKNKNQGIIIAYGGSGNGKTSYIKYLSQQLDKLFIFIPTNQLDILTSPSILTVLLEHPKSILILEDAEKALISRDENENASLVSTILNIADGILGSMLQTLLIVTFNTEKRNIDPAIYRKGRLLIEWEFEKLSVENSLKLAKHLGKDENLIKEEMSLADIYNLDEKTFHKEKTNKRIGFSK